MQNSFTLAILLLEWSNETAVVGSGFPAPQGSRMLREPGSPSHSTTGLSGQSPTYSHSTDTSGGGAPGLFCVSLAFATV